MALYHKYRPQIFSDIVDQAPIVKTITNQIKQDKVAHAYLFSGPRGIGKTTTARLLAKALNCEKRKKTEFEPCNSCHSCNEISSSRAIDVIEMDAASHTGVDNVRENIIENSQFQPSKSKNKIFIIDEVHMLSVSAFNALLKTLEEPPKHVIFILATTEIHKLPETIISRCQVFNFKKIPFLEMEKYLSDIAKKEDIKIDKDVIERIINKSDGCARDAISLLDQLMATGEKKITNETASLVLPSSNVQEIVDFIRALIENQAEKALKILNACADEGKNILQFANDSIEILRLMMIAKANPAAEYAGLDINDKVKKELIKLSGEIENKNLIELIDLILKRKQEIKSAPIPQLPLEMLIIEWTSNHGPQDDTQHKSKNITDNQEYNNGTMGQWDNKKGEKKAEDTKKTEKIKQKVKKIVKKETPVEEEQVKKIWKEFLQKIEQRHHSIAFILKMANIESTEGNQINLSVEYPFHKDKLCEKIYQKEIEAVFSDLIGSKVRVNIEIGQKRIEKKVDEELQELASAFGGEIVN